MNNEGTCLYFALRFCVVQLVTQVKMPHKRKFFSLVERVKVIELNNKNKRGCRRLGHWRGRILVGTGWRGGGSSDALHIILKTTAPFPFFDSNGK